jgi:AmmeMemoRadiSam system protein A
VSELSAEAGRWLVAAARHAIATRLGLPAADPGAPTAELAGPRGTFVTLLAGAAQELRGCIGFVEPRGALSEAVREAAAAAAFRDPRFGALRPSDWSGITVEVSVLTPPAPIAPEDVVVGVHGLIVRKGGRSGLLLPQVPGEHGWDREQFLDYTCRKAGLPEGAWREGGSELLAFSAQVFEER